MITKPQILDELRKVLTQENTDRINELISKMEGMSDEELAYVLHEKRIKTVRDVKRFVQSKPKERRTTTNRFTELNELVSYGTSGKTIHIHVVPKDARALLTREGFKQAELSLIDATEKVKRLIQTDKKYAKIENVYAVSGIISGPVARWFRTIGYDVKTLPIEEAKTDSELKKFYKRFKKEKKLGRAVLSTEKLMTDEWEQQKDARKEALGVPVKSNEFIDSLKGLAATDKEIIKHKHKLQEEPKVEKTSKVIESI